MEWSLLQEWSRPVPRVEDRLLKTVIYLYKDEAAANSGEPGGSGCLVGEPCAIPEAVFLFAVTNAHVARVCPVIRTAGPRDKRIFVRKESDWHRHSDGDDIVVTPIGFAPKDARDFYLDYVPREWFVAPENFTNATHDLEAARKKDLPLSLPPLDYVWEHQPLGWPFGPGEEVVMLGRFLGYDGADENKPAARFGHLAMAPTVPIPHPWGFTQSSFLIECRSVSGYSGSPVFIYRVQTTISAGFVAIGADRGKNSLPRFLGIDWGNLDRVGLNDYAVDWANADAEASFPRRSGMMVAVPAWRLAELLSSTEVQDMKKKSEAEAKKSARGVNLDSDPSESHTPSSPTPDPPYRFSSITPSSHRQTDKESN
jgi:hypothetical protein